jgi:cell division protein FtsN
MAQASRRKPQSPAWVWFLAGAVVSGLVSGLVCKKLNNNPSLPKPVVQMPVEPPKPEPKKDAAPKPRFDFYTVLPEMEVVIPEEEIRKPPKIEPEKASTDKTSADKITADKTSTAPVFLLQMGSFRNYQDADRLKAKLGMLGIESDIQSVTIANAQGKSTVHRVRGGPYTQSQAHAINEQLKNSQVNSIVIKINKE